ncbi:MAG: ABC transporter permease [Coleofasciculus sp. S288]|nr:ABC transporter permease [Coleofasciculus sp. S288]
MTSPQHGARLNDWANPASSVIEFIYKTFVVTELEVRKLRHNPTQLLTRAVQPVLWLVVFGQVFTSIRAIPTGGLPYLDFMAPGILAQSILFMAIFSGLSIIWERDLGILHKLLVSPTPRVTLVLGKALAAGIRSLSQAIIVYAVAFPLRIQLDLSFLALVGVVVTVLLTAALFSNLSLLVACLIKTQEGFMGIGQLLTMPLFFASNAIYPLALMPSWLQVISSLNPLTYAVDALRSLMLVGEASTYWLGLDFGILLGVTAVLAVVCGRLYPNLVT